MRFTTFGAATASASGGAAREHRIREAVNATRFLDAPFTWIVRFCCCSTEAESA
jgi:hypothetical protein